MLKKILMMSAMILVAVVGCSSILEKLSLPAVKENYQGDSSIKMPLEKRYTQNGEYFVKNQVIESKEKEYKIHKVWYPSEIENSNKKYPLVVMVNGTGVPYQKYEKIFEHLASWGFVVVGNDDPSSWNGKSTDSSLKLMMRLNRDKESVFYNRIDENKIGAGGHSQGGVGAINAVTNYPDSKLYKALYTASTTKHALAVGLKWDYDVSKIKIPYFMNAGTGVFDAGNGKDKDSGIAPISSLEENYAKISENGLTVMARRSNTDHGEMLYLPDGYMTAWFRYHLLNDSEAGKVFVGEKAEIKNNQNWTDVKIKNK